MLAKVDELGYQPNAVARSLSLRRTHTLGIVIPDLMHSFFVEIVAGIESVASSRGYGLLLCSSNEDPRKERAELEMLRSARWTASSWRRRNASGNTDLLQQPGRAGHRAGHDRPRRSPAPSSAIASLTDDEQVGRWPRAISSNRAPRDRAHRAARRSSTPGGETSGLAGGAAGARHSSARDEWIVRGGFMDADGYRAMKRLLAVKPRIDAVFAANDPSAIGAMKAIWEAGLRVPDDIAVVGVGDIALGDLLRVPLTTVGWSRRDQGRTPRSCC